MVELVVAGHFQDAAVGREVAGENLDGPLCLVGVVDGVQVVLVDGVVVGEFALLFEVSEFLRDGPAGDGHGVAVEQVRL